MAIRPEEPFKPVVHSLLVPEKETTPFEYQMMPLTIKKWTLDVY